MKSSESAVPRRGVVSWASSAMRDLETEIAFAVRCDLNVMITGEGGVGKKSIAHRVHRESRAAAPLVIARSPGALDTAEALDRALLDAKPDGTVLLEDVDRMSRSMQSWLLDTIAKCRTRRSAARDLLHGGHVRFVSTTSRDLFELVQFDQFSERLFYRLNTTHLIVPPLRERPEDIPVLLRHFFSLHTSTAVPRLSAAAWQRLMAYAWPDNLRELKTVADTLAVSRLPRLLEPDDLPPNIRQ
jgi:DNA-binding NtrC family response regulator